MQIAFHSKYRQYFNILLLMIHRNNIPNHYFIVLMVIVLVVMTVKTERIHLEKFPINPILINQLENRLNRLLRYLQKRYHKDKGELYYRVKVC